MSTARVALGMVELHLPDVESLKGKRHVLKGLKERVRARFECSVAEVLRLRALWFILPLFFVNYAASGAIRFEDPRLPLMMAAAPRRTDAPEELQSFVAVKPRASVTTSR